MSSYAQMSFWGPKNEKVKNKEGSEFFPEFCCIQQCKFTVGKKLSQEKLWPTTLTCIFMKTAFRRKLFWEHFFSKTSLHI
jgi:hypothetical protein